MDAPSPAPAGHAEPPAAHGHARRPSLVLRCLRGLGWLFGGLLAIALAGALLLGVGLAAAWPQLPDIHGLTDYRPKLPLRVFTADGMLLGEFGEEKRTFVPIAEVPKVMKDAVLAIEDARFYRHHGVDYVGIVRAGVAQFQKAKSQGASTITMQVARNFYLPTEKTFTRKIYEILLALKIENQLTKDQILELYMNQIYLGQRAYGFAAAAEVYYGKRLRDVNLAEAAMLAGLPQAPSAYNPVSNPERSQRRQRYILDRMEQNGFISEQEAASAKQQELRIARAPEPDIRAEYAAETARLLIASQYGAETTTRGLNVYLTIDSTEQMAAYRALRRGLLDYERRQAYRGPEGFVDLPKEPAAQDAKIAEALAEHPDNDELRAAVVTAVAPRKVTAVLQSGQLVELGADSLRLVGSALSERADSQRRIRRGAIVRLLKTDKGGWLLTHQPEVEGAFVSMDPSTGAIRTMVGGWDFNKSKFNHVTQAWRQPGSSFKPFVYSAALEQGFTAQTWIADSPLFFDAQQTGSQPWEPKNYDGGFGGPLTLKQGLAKSKNMVSIRVLQHTGLQFAQSWATRFGFDADKTPPFLTMALGAGSVTPLQMASAYSVFANGGLRVQPILITRITDAAGRVLQESPLQPVPESARAIDARNAFVMTELLGEVTRAGTAAQVQKQFGRNDLYGKTGTTNDSMDAWFAGYQPSLVAVVWIGYDTPHKLGDKETGGGLSLPVWMDYMKVALKGVPVAQREVPPGLVERRGDWIYEEFADGQGIRSVDVTWRRRSSSDGEGEPQVPGEAPAPTPSPEQERENVLDMFRR